MLLTYLSTNFNGIARLQVSGRRLQSYGGTVHEKWGGLLQAPIPAWLQTTLSKIDQDFHLYDGAANHVLLNAYEPGQGILVSSATASLGYCCL